MFYLSFICTFFVFFSYIKQRIKEMRPYVFSFMRTSLSPNMLSSSPTPTPTMPSPMPTTTTPLPTTLLYLEYYTLS